MNFMLLEKDIWKEEFQRIEKFRQREALREKARHCIFFAFIFS